MLHEDYRIAPSHCCGCGKEMDAATPLGGGRGPQEGDMAICLDCGHLQFYGANLVMRNPTDAEVIEVAGDPELIMAMKMISTYNKWKEGLSNAAQTPPDNRAARRARRHEG